MVPQVMASLIVFISGRQDDKVIFFFCGIAFLITYIFKNRLVQKIFNPKTLLSYGIYFTLVYVIIIAVLSLTMSFIF